MALFFLTIPLSAESQDRPASVLLQFPGINLQQIRFGEFVSRFFKMDRDQSVLAAQKT